MSLYRALRALVRDPTLQLGDLPPTDEGVAVAEGLVQALRMDLVDYDEETERYKMTPEAVLMATQPVRLVVDNAPGATRKAAP